MTAQDIQKNTATGIVRVVGIGPGALDLLAPRALSALQQAEVIIGYRTYLELVESCFNPKAEVVSSAMMQEIDRCRKALELAQSGHDVALVCGGDPGIYAMAGLVFELAKNQNNTCAIEIIPGIAALNACAAVLGAPLMHDFAAISLSDLLTPWELIEKRLEAAAAADFVAVLYNPKSKNAPARLSAPRKFFWRTGLVPHRWALSMPRAVRMKACSSAPWQTCSVPRSACRARSPLATHRPLSGKSG